MRTVAAADVSAERTIAYGQAEADYIVSGDAAARTAAMDAAQAAWNVGMAPVNYAHASGSLDARQARAQTRNAAEFDSRGNAAVEFAVSVGQAQVNYATALAQAQVELVTAMQPVQQQRRLPRPRAQSQETAGHPADRRAGRLLRRSAAG